ncbi:small subunit ribosomal protein S28e [Nematocida minor]|uniref:small subunit ribosomal protein S28e n=1 Tax=Nematocida minor TaxID=1912983 RepID=UPI00221F4211|nr:small subunit ribosomal protein S28e [Nematocida minor]KAI5193229.1 small subunit ribosomal protein S28e [Nematocida minor]
MEVGAEPVLAQVSEILYRTGTGGSCQLVKVTIESTGRNLTRIIEGPVQMGDRVYLLEAERDLKMSRR